MLFSPTHLVNPVHSLRGYPAEVRKPARRPPVPPCQRTLHISILHVVESVVLLVHARGGGGRGRGEGEGDVEVEGGRDCDTSVVGSSELEPREITFCGTTTIGCNAVAALF